MFGRPRDLIRFVEGSLLYGVNAAQLATVGQRKVIHKDSEWGPYCGLRMLLLHGLDNWPRVTAVSKQHHLNIKERTDNLHTNFNLLLSL